jgi:hypothetical protein
MNTTELLYLEKCSTRYNVRPGEICGMGKESTTSWTTIPEPLVDIVNRLAYNSSLKHEDNLEWIYGTEEFRVREDWTSWIGEPMFFIYDIEIIPVNENTDNE